MNIFKKIANLIEGTPDKKEQKTSSSVTEDNQEENSCSTESAEAVLPPSQEENQPPQATESVKGKNAIDTEEKILSSIVKVFDSVYKGKKSNLHNKKFTLWVADNRLFDMVKGQNFSNELILKLANEGYNTAWNSVRLEMPAQNHTFTRISDHIFLQIEDKEAIRSVGQKAKITVVQGKGSLLQEMYLLDSKERQRYNIGVGILPDMEGKGFRENHIVIDDSPHSPHYENNKYVSRAHAYISFSEMDGFCLQVEMGGSRIYNGRTRILRCEEKIEVDNLENQEPLQDGDIIELGKSVYLRFEKNI